MSRILLRCPYGHDSEFTNEVSSPEPYMSSFDVRSTRSVVKFWCKTCGRQFEGYVMHTVYSNDDRETSQDTQQSVFHEVGGPWQGERITLVSVE